MAMNLRLWIETATVYSPVLFNVVAGLHLWQPEYSLLLCHVLYTKLDEGKINILILPEEALFGKSFGYLPTVY